MEIHILIRTIEPLTGTAMTGGEESLEFQGWMELLSTLSTLVGGGRHRAAGEPDASRGRVSREGGADDRPVSTR